MCKKQVKIYNPVYEESSATRHYDAPCKATKGLYQNESIKFQVKNFRSIVPIILNA
jgi:hypothetical protein